MKHATGKPCALFWTRVMFACCGFGAAAQAQEWSADREQLVDAYPAPAYSPYVGRTFPERPLWGDTHLHTGQSMDAGGFGARLTPEQAYRFARGEEIVSSSGQPVRLSRPLDWLAITDHSDGVGLINDTLEGKPDVVRYPQGRHFSDAFRAGGEEAVQATLELIGAVSQGTIDPNLFANYQPGARRFATIWSDNLQTAERFYEPGVFTPMLGFEWTSLVAGNNMHRNVIFRDGPARAGQVVPMTMTPPWGSPDVEDLYKWMQAYEDKTKGAVLALAHNGNLSNGVMFPVQTRFDGSPVDRSYVQARAKWEPLYEITQIKGDGETHPFLSPNDEFADYFRWDVGNLDLSTKKKKSMLSGEYAREALKNGLLLESKFGTNPYKVGFSGGTDSHTGLVTAEEENFFGKHTGYEPSASRLQHPLFQSDQGKIFAWQMVAAGLTAVWATENTREAIFDAMQRREVYATTGPRMAVRFFGGWKFNSKDLNTRLPATVGYQKGVPMGADLMPRPKGAKAPTFMALALRDPIGANLDRIQMVKGWLNPDGTTSERVYDISWSGQRKPRRDGKIPAVGNTVDVAAATWTNTIGASELGTVWTDPVFDPSRPAFYYLRVIEIPTPPWYVYDAYRYGVPLPKGAPTSQQERAYSSPIWYSPEP